MGTSPPPAAGRGPDAVSAADDALDALVVQLEDVITRLQSLAERAALLRARRHDGTPWQELVTAEHRPLVVEVLSDVLGLWGLGDAETAFDALLVVSELVGNAVRHGADRVVLALEQSADVLVVAVEDGSAVLPGARDLDPDAESGRGMRIVEAVALRWGVSELSPGKRVWAELAWA